MSKNQHKRARKNSELFKATHNGGSYTFLPKIQSNHAQQTNHLYQPNEKLKFEELDLDKMERKEVFLQAYYKARRKMIVSEQLDEAVKKRLGILKYDAYEKRELIYPKKPKMKKEMSWFNDYYYKYRSLNEADEEDDELMSQFKVDWSQLSQKFNNNRKNGEQQQQPRFGSTLSKDAQFALMKSLEDTIAHEIVNVSPELANKIQRTKTAQYVRKYSHNNNSSSSNRSDFSSSTTNSTIKSEFSSDITNNASSLEFVNNNVNEFEMVKKLAVSEQINSAMDLLDNIRRVKKSKAAKSNGQKKSTHFELVNQVSGGENVVIGSSPPNGVKSLSLSDSTASKQPSVTLPPIKKPTISRTSKLGLVRAPSTVLKLESNLVKYNEWKSQWFSQLQNI